MISSNTDRDYTVELHRIEQAINLAQQKLGQLQYEKDSLAKTKLEIISTCNELGIKPVKEEIEKAITNTRNSLQSSLNALDKDLKR